MADEKKKPKPPVSRDVLDPKHPAHGVFKAWVEKNCGDTVLTLRKARRFRAQNERYFTPQAG